MTKDLLVKSETATIVEDPDTIPMSVRLPTKEEKILQKEEAKGKREESPSRERRSRDDRYERRYSRRSKDSERKEKSSRSYTKRRHQAHVGEWVSGSDSDNHSERSYHSDSEYAQDEGVAGLALVSTDSYDIFD